MPDFFSDPRYLAPIVTSAGIAVTLVLWVLNLRSKELSFEILANTPILSLQEEVKDQIQIYCQGQIVHNVDSVVMRITNVGNVPIRASEFAGKFLISLPASTKVLMSEVAETQPPDLSDRLAIDQSNPSLIERTDGSDVVLRPVLLNPKDSFTIRMLVAPTISTAKVVAHVEGMAAVKQSKENSFVPIVLANVGAFIMAVSLFFLDPNSLFSNNILQYLPYLFFFLFGYIMLLSGVYYPRINKRSLTKALKIGG